MIRRESKRMGLMPKTAQGRLKIGKSLAIVDIGSNSVRLVAYEGLTRSPTPIFNEKALCGLGRGVMATGLLAEEAMEKAYEALRRYRVLCDIMKITDVEVIATAAARDAKNGAVFLKECSRIMRVKAQLLTGKREAKLSALGVAYGIHKADGLVADLGGGSLELISVKGSTLGKGVTLPIGVISLQDLSEGNLKKAQKIIRDQLDDLPQLKSAREKSIYVIGGTWRALARLHMKQRGYPLQVMHNYVIPVRDAKDFTALVERVSTDTIDSIEAVSAARRPLIAYGALVLEELIKKCAPVNIVVSALGVREGLIFERLSKKQLKEDPLIRAAHDLNILRSRSPQHCEEIIGWTDQFMKSTHFEETPDEKRLRHAACLLADIGWRAHPDYRGEQSLNIIANASFIGVDHPGRVYLALAVAYRHMGLGDDQISPRLRELATSRMLDRARILGGALRVAYLITAAMPGVLEYAPLYCTKETLTLEIPKELAPLAGERVFNRLKALARIIGRTPEMLVVE
jgi:exopolyphosphatase/guanosine-5'-triphosphate,3'-diphosphate pyrophosphatase